MQFVTGSRIPAFQGLGHEIVDFDPGERFARYHQGQNRTFNLFLPLLLLATAAWLAEGWLANPVRVISEHVIPSHGASSRSQSNRTHTTFEQVEQTVAAGRGGA